MKVLIFFIASILSLVNVAFAPADEISNRVFILHSGYVQPVEGKGFLPGAQTDGARKVASTVSLVKAKGMVLIADPGMAAPGVWEKILTRMNSLGVKPEEVTHVFISHHHPDHVTHLGLFPNAIIVDFWATYKDDVWSDHPDPYELAPGVNVHRTPGHTDEDASLLVETTEGVYALTHLWWGPDYQPDKDPLAEDAVAIEQSRNKILGKADWIVPGHGNTFFNSQRGPQTISEANQSKLLNAVKNASAQWVNFFNEGNAQGAASLYEKDAIMVAKPFGVFSGRKNILGFWQKLIADGYKNGVYIEPKMEVINSRTVVISSKWKMNKAHGVIAKELWVLGKDGRAHLRMDEFEALGEK